MKKKNLRLNSKRKYKKKRMTLMMMILTSLRGTSKMKRTYRTRTMSISFRKKTQRR